MNYFTHYWQNKTWEKNRESNPPGTLLDHISGNTFRKRGIEPGDAGYVVTVRKGELFLCGKMIVGRYSDIYESAEITGLSPRELYDADEHIIASQATEMLWDRKVPLSIAKQLKFLGSDGITALKIDGDGLLDRQTLRPVRLLTEDSAKLLDGLLGKIKTTSTANSGIWTDDLSDPGTDFESFPEGERKRKFVTYYERNPENRRQAIEIHGCSCKACGFDFQKTYGEHGRGFIHVHHIKPVSQYERSVTINPKTDLTVLCPNCHAMVHRAKDKTLTVEELKKLIRGR